MERYRKLVAALVGLGILYAKVRGIDLAGTEVLWIDLIIEGTIALGTLFGVYQAANAPASPVPDPAQAEGGNT